jgi:hypothetical protein
MRIQLIVFLLVIVFMSAGCSNGNQASGTLTGHVDIGPLQPISRVGQPEPTPSPEMYAAWQIVVLAENGKREIARAGINSKGNYQIQLPAGKYNVTAKPVNGAGVGGQQEHSVGINKGETIHLDISIDTGIR